MTDIDTLADDAIDVPSILKDRPSSVAEALDLHVRLTALSGWVSDRQKRISGWLKDKGEAALEAEGAIPTWRLPAGQVILTDPKPKPSIEDREAFAAWYEQAGGTVARRRTAHTDPDALLAFHDRMADIVVDDQWQAGEAAVWLLEAVTVTEDVLLPEDVLDRLLAGDDLPVPDVGARCVIHTPDDADPYVVDTVDGGPVPGVTVRPAGSRTIQVKPTPDAKARVRRELESLIGPPVLEA